jgi:hypothetical protein
MPLIWPGERDRAPDEPRPDLTQPRIGPALREAIEQDQRIRDNRQREKDREK